MRLTPFVLSCSRITSARAVFHSDRRPRLGQSSPGSASGARSGSVSGATGCAGTTPPPRASSPPRRTRCATGRPFHPGQGRFAIAYYTEIYSRRGLYTTLATAPTAICSSAASADQLLGLPARNIAGRRASMRYRNRSSQLFNVSWMPSPLFCGLAPLSDRRRSRRGMCGGIQSRRRLPLRKAYSGYFS